MGAIGAVLGVLGKIFNILPLAVQIMELAGSILKPGQKTGPEKAQVVKQMIADAVKGSELVSGKDIVNDDLFNSGLDDLTSGAVKVMKSVGKWQT